MVAKLPAHVHCMMAAAAAAAATASVRRLQGPLLHALWWMTLPSIVLRPLLLLLLGPAAARANTHTPCCC
jgi:hypothetical protein